MNGTRGVRSGGWKDDLRLLPTLSIAHRRIDIKGPSVSISHITLGNWSTTINWLLDHSHSSKWMLSMVPSFIELGA